MIGETLYPLIFRLLPRFAQNITGVLLEMDNSALLSLLQSGQQLKNQFDEALRV